MKSTKTKKKSRKNLALILSGSLVALLVVGFTINSLQQPQTAESQAADIESVLQRHIKVEGGVGIGEFKTPTELFSPTACPGQNVTVAPTMTVTSNKMGAASWACDPQAGFHLGNPTYKKINKGTAVTLTPPTGYTCSDNYVYISNSKELRYKKEAKNTGTGCTAKVIPGLATKSMYVWFTLAPLN